MPPTKGNKMFNPLSSTVVPLGRSRLARTTKQKREEALVEAEFLAHHFQLDDQGRLGETENSTKISHAARTAIRKRLSDFPRIPQYEADRLESIIAKYGLPLSALSSDTAAFILRRVMFDYHRLSVLRRRVRKPLFTPEELIELMRVMNVKPFQLAHILEPVRFNAANGLIHRWIHGVNHPTGLTAIKTNRLIEQQVRRKKAGGFPAPRQEEALSDKPATVERRSRLRRAEKALNLPLASAARKQREGNNDADATDRT
jgi:hypothetical protein